jgi:tRNA pseudouridine55 synthase
MPQYTPVPLPELRRLFRRDPRALVGRVPGLFPVDKPEGLSSHDVVARARKRLGLRRVGHGGTLDPIATGVLILLAGNATRLFDDLQGLRKTYRAALRLGRRTDTQDRTGTVLEERPVPPLSEADLEAALAPFRGPIRQVPPLHSALKKDGRPLYELARRGETVERPPREVTVYDLACTARRGEELELTMTVSKGFYVRTLIDDLGRALGCGAVMTALRRTAVGPFTVEEAVSVEALARPSDEPPSA